jgi:hypothetical protein
MASSIFAERLVRRVQKVGVGLVVGAPNAAAQLVELREAELVGIVDDDRVDVGDVDPVLDDRGRNEHVDVALDEAGHHGLELALGHLAVANGDARLGNELFERAGDGVDRLDPVVNVIHLTAAIELGHDRALHDRIGRRHDDGLDRHPILGRGLNQREITHAHERHLQRARNRRRRERQHVDGRAHLLEPLFVHHAEALLLIHDNEAQIAKDDIFLQNAMGSDDDVDMAVG